MPEPSTPQRVVAEQGVTVRVYLNGEPDAFPSRPDAVTADAEGFTLVFDPELCWYSWRDGYSFRIGND